MIMSFYIGEIWTLWYNKMINTVMLQKGTQRREKSLKIYFNPYYCRRINHRRWFGSDLFSAKYLVLRKAFPMSQYSVQHRNMELFHKVCMKIELLW